MAELTLDRLAELRQIAEAATPGPLTMHLCDDARYAAFVDAPHLGPDAPELAVFLIERDARFFAEFDRDTVLTMLGELERLRRELDSVVDIAAAALDHVRKRYNGDSDSFGDIEEALLDAGFTMNDLDASPGLGQAREDVLALLDGARGSVMDRGQDENDFIPPEQVDTGCPICGEPRLWCWCDGEKGGGGRE